MNKPFIEPNGDSLYRHPFDIENIDGYILPEKFPLCCPFHKSIFSNSIEWFENFPDCCDYHKAQKKQWWFKREKFQNLPIKIVKQFSYTVNHIKLRIDSED